MNKVLLILSGNLIKDSQGQWRTTNFIEQPPARGLGDRLRIIAADYLYQRGLADLLIVSGGQGNLKKIPGFPKIAAIMKKELLALGVPTAKIKTDFSAQNTHEQLQRIKKYFSQHNIGLLTIISNKYHVPRIKVMLNNDPFLKRLAKRGKIKIQAAETILLEYDTLAWRSQITKAYQSPLMKKRIEQEQLGIKLIKLNHYDYEKYRH